MPRRLVIAARIVIAAEGAHVPLDYNRAMPEGLILRVDAKIAHVQVGDQVLQLPLRGRLFDGASSEKRPLAVGDRVALTVEADHLGSAIDAVLPRQSRLSRRSAGEDGREQVIAANVTHVLIVTALREPTFEAALVDRILVAAERESLPATLVLTKVDRDKRGDAEQWTTLYRGLGYDVHVTSVTPGHETTASLEALRDLLHRNLTVLCGPSGAGKSTLINKLVPGVQLRTGAVGKIQQGKHTTTHTQLVPLPGGGHVLDTPGIRNFGLFGVNTQEIAFYFRDIKAHAGKCGYSNCSHRREPDCAVRAAVDPSRLRSYEMLLAEVEREGRER